MADRAETARRPSLLGYRGSGGVRQVASSADVESRGGSRFIAVATLEGFPRCHSMPCGGSGNGRAHPAGPYGRALLLALNGWVPARKET